jgi:hypothetical protein
MFQEIKARGKLFACRKFNIKGQFVLLKIKTDNCDSSRCNSSSSSIVVVVVVVSKVAAVIATMSTY